MAAPCAELPELTGTDGKTVLPWALSVVRQYNDCSARQRGLVAAWPG